MQQPNLDQEMLRNAKVTFSRRTNPSILAIVSHSWLLFQSIDRKSMPSQGQLSGSLQMALTSPSYP